MAHVIDKPALIEAAGALPKQIEEFFGRVSSGHSDVSIARMTSPPGWDEPGQTPEFDEYSLVLDGDLVVETRTGTAIVAAGQAILAPRDEWVRYSTPRGATYVSVCIPAFSLVTVHRDE